MPRIARLLLPGLPVHVMQRGHNRARCFMVAGERELYLALLGEFAERYACRIHAYVLMTNHVHLLLSADDPSGVSGLMSGVNQRFVQYMNRKYERTGSLWAGRFRSSIVDNDAYLFTCQRYIELNPVRAGMAVHPAQYPWSSFRTNALGLPSTLVTPHPQYLALGPSPAARQEAYRALFDAPIEAATLERIRSASRAGRPVGSASFVAQVHRQLARLGTPGVPGRPKNQYPREELQGPVLPYK